MMMAMKVLLMPTFIAIMKSQIDFQFKPRRIPHATRGALFL